VRSFHTNGANIAYDYKTVSLTKSVSNFTPKYFYEIEHQILTKDAQQSVTKFIIIAAKSN
jgi:hypothetical protein